MNSQELKEKYYYFKETENVFCNKMLNINKMPKSTRENNIGEENLQVLTLNGRDLSI